MTKEDKNLAAAQAKLMYAAQDMARAMNRVDDKVPTLYRGLVGEDVFVAGHRFNIIGTLREVLIEEDGTPIAILDCAHQIGRDDLEKDTIVALGYLGDDMRFPRSSVGWTVQPVSSRPPGWRRAWEQAKAKIAAQEEARRQRP